MTAQNPWRSGTLNQLIVQSEELGAGDVAKRLEAIRDKRTEFENSGETDITKRLAIFCDLMNEAGSLIAAMEANTARREAERLKNEQHQHDSSKSNSATPGFWNRIRRPRNPR
jgi:hypothetical protein